MIDRDDELTELLGPLDPVAVDPPPEPGSTRHRHIEDNVMNTTTRHEQPDPSVKGEATAADPDRSRRRSWSLMATAAAVAAVVAAVGLLVIPASTPTAEAAVRTAAENHAALIDFRMTLTSDDLAFLPGGSATAAIDGTNVHMVAGDQEYIRFGDTEWFGQGGRFESSSVEEYWTPFGEASAQVIAAALASNQVTDAGSETLDDVETTRYRIQLDDASRSALADVPSSAQYWFTAETSESAEVLIDEDGNEVPVSAGRTGFLEDAEAIVIWVADDLVHQIEVSTGSTQFTFTFSDFGADITVTPPE